MPFLTVCLNPTLQKTLRFSSVVPGDVNRTVNHRLDASGKGINVTRVLEQLGKKAVHLTQLGGELRPLFLSLCNQDKLSVEWVESSSPIRFCHTIINDNDKTVTELIEESETVDAGTEDRLLDKFNKLIGTANFSVLIISGTKAGGFSDDVIPYMVRTAKENGLRIILDIKGKDLLESLQYEPDIIKPNLSEFTETFNIEKTTQLQSRREHIKSIAKDVSNKYKTCVILTDGSQKLIAADGDTFLEMEPQSIDVINTTGCGDAFTAGLAGAISDSKSTGEAIVEGIRCGALNAGLLKPGVIR